MTDWDRHIYTIDTMHKIVTNENPLDGRKLYSVLCGDLNGKEILKRGDICKHTADSLCCTAEKNTTL